MGSESSSIDGMEIVALGCEMIEGIENKNKLASRVSIVNYHGKVIFDTYVNSSLQNDEDYTIHSGIQPHQLNTALHFSNVQRNDVQKFLSLKIVVGHCLQIDYKAYYV